MTTPPLETARLWLRPLQLEDADQTQILFPHWEVVKHLHSLIPWPYPPGGARQFYEHVELPAMARGEHWTWSLRLKTDPDQLIGSISLMRGEYENRGFWLGLTGLAQPLVLGGVLQVFGNHAAPRCRRGAPAEVRQAPPAGYCPGTASA